MKIIIFNGKLELDGSEVSSGYVKIASDTMAVVREFSHAKWWFSIVMLEYWRVISSRPRENGGFHRIFHQETWWVEWDLLYGYVKITIDNGFPINSMVIFIVM